MITPYSHLYIQTPKSRVSSAEDLQKAFKNLDQENQGIIKKSTILAASMYTSQFYDRSIIQKELQKCSEEITFDKFTRIFQMAQVYKQDTSASWIFKLYDKDQKGYIDRNDLIRASKITGIQLSEQEISEMLSAQNPLVQGKVYFDDFAEIMARQVNFSDIN